MAELADAWDLKSHVGEPTYRFEPGHRHQLRGMIRMCHLPFSCVVIDFGRKKRYTVGKAAAGRLDVPGRTGRKEKAV